MQVSDCMCVMNKNSIKSDHPSIVTRDSKNAEFNQENLGSRRFTIALKGSEIAFGTLPVIHFVL